MSVGLKSVGLYRFFNGLLSFCNGFQLFSIAVLYSYINNPVMDFQGVFFYETICMNNRGLLWRQLKFSHYRIQLRENNQNANAGCCIGYP